MEDGIEQLNVFKENVIIMIHRSFSLLNTDQTPAAFWITNANNRYIGNRAVGSHTLGFGLILPICQLALLPTLIWGL